MNTVDNTDNIKSICANSGKSDADAAGTNLKTCNGCKLVKYCNRECQCQSAHWKLHKKRCKTQQELNNNVGVLFTLPVKEAIRRGLVDSKSAADDNIGEEEEENLLVDISDPPAFGIGSRVECPLLRLVSGYEKLDSYSGTVMKHNVTLGLQDGSTYVAPYYVRLDCGGKQVCNIESFFEKLDEPPIKVAHKPGSHVLASSVMNGFRELYPPQSKAKELRFKVGDRVECNVQIGQTQDEMRFLPGTIVATNYWEQTFEGSFTAPYQVKLDEVEEGFQSLIFAPMDDDMLIRASTVPPPQCWICYENHMTEDNLIVRECGCKGGTNGFVHVECLVKLAKSKANFDVEVTDFDTQIFPFMGCITCRQPFEFDSHCGIALSKMFYDITRDLDIKNTWAKIATTRISETLKECKEYDRAKEILQERISRIREKIETETGMLNEEEEGEGSSFNADFGHRALNTTLYRLLKDLASFLLELSGVYEKKEMMDEMKEVAEEALLVSKSLEEHKVPSPGAGEKVCTLQTLESMRMTLVINVPHYHILKKQSGLKMIWMTWKNRLTFPSFSGVRAI